jgi:triosephosphate isomerase (TIM)
MARRYFLAGNWKMNHGSADAAATAKKMAEMFGGYEKVDIGIAPTSLTLTSVAQGVKGSKIKVGGQNCRQETKGAYTGEVSPVMLKEAGAQFCIVGHSERRQFFAETDEGVNLKVKAVLASGLDVIMCIGETLAQRQAGITMPLNELQLRAGLLGITKEQMTKITVAYEPVWAIGTGVNATPQQAQEVHAHLRKILTEMFGKEVAEATRIQYGGSVKPDNVKELMDCDDIDGALVGGASLKPDDFCKIVKFMD